MNDIALLLEHSLEQQSGTRDWKPYRGKLKFNFKKETRPHIHFKTPTQANKLTQMKLNLVVVKRFKEKYAAR